MRICILCEESKVSQAREKMKNDNILKIDLSPTGELPATHKFCFMAVTDEKAKRLMDSAELTIIEAMGPKEFLEKHNLKKVGTETWVDNVKEAFEMTYVECETTKTELFKIYQQEELKEIVNFQKIKPITEEERKVLLSILTRK